MNIEWMYLTKMLIKQKTKCYHRFHQIRSIKIVIKIKRRPKDIPLINRHKINICIKILTIILENLTPLRQHLPITDSRLKINIKKMSKVKLVPTLLKNNFLLRKKFNKLLLNLNLVSQNLIPWLSPLRKKSINTQEYLEKSFLHRNQKLLYCQVMMVK